MVKLTTGFLITSVLFSTFAFSESPKYHPNHLFIKMKEGNSLVKSPLINSSKKIINNLYLVKTTDPKVLERILKNKSNIDYIQKDFYSKKLLKPKLESLEEVGPKYLNTFKLDTTVFNDPNLSKLWAFEDSNGMRVLSAYTSLPIITPVQVVVAVADTGVDHTHEDLKDVMWVNQAEIPNDGIDNDGNGYIDDVHGINLLVRDSEGRATSNTMASHWHGTHVAGTIGATQNNGIGIAGVASNVKIMALRVVPDDSDELDSNIVEAFKYAAKMGAKIINCSFGKQVNEGGLVVRDVINEIGQKYGVLVVASAGNDSQGPMYYANNDVSPKYPASFDSENLLVVASTTNSGSMSSFSNIGPVTVDVAAPGSNIFSTINNNKYSYASGTSMAAPNTTGVAAMIRGYKPELTPEEVKDLIIRTTTPVEKFKDLIFSGGRVNLEEALNNL